MINIRKTLKMLLIAFIVVLLNSSFAYSADIFDTMAGNATNFAVGLRNFAYVISGFGIIMFTFLAISGKINFKHLGYIVLCLFFLSAVGSLIVYITNGGSTRAGLNLESKFGTAYKNAGVGKSSSL